MSANTDSKTPKEQTAEICDDIRSELGLKEHKGKTLHTLTQTEKKAILDELRD